MSTEMKNFPKRQKLPYVLAHKMIECGRTDGRGAKPEMWFGIGFLIGVAFFTLMLAWFYGE